jgi:preprotein translocase subunit SecA
MNSQREVVYRRRKNALMGDRLELDILNIMYDVSEDIIEMGKSTEDIGKPQNEYLQLIGH